MSAANPSKVLAGNGLQPSTLAGSTFAAARKGYGMAAPTGSGAPNAAVPNARPCSVGGTGSGPVTFKTPAARVPDVVLAATVIYSSEGWSVVPLPGPAFPADRDTKIPASAALISAVSSASN